MNKILNIAAASCLVAIVGCNMPTSQFRVTVGEGGSVVGGDVNCTGPNMCNVDYPAAPETWSLEAQADSEHTFSHWIGFCAYNTDAFCQFNVSSGSLFHSTYAFFLPTYSSVAGTVTLENGSNLVGATRNAVEIMDTAYATVFGLIASHKNVQIPVEPIDDGSGMLQIATIDILCENNNGEGGTDGTLIGTQSAESNSSGVGILIDVEYTNCKANDRTYNGTAQLWILLDIFGHIGVTGMQAAEGIFDDVSVTFDTPSSTHLLNGHIFSGTDNGLRVVSSPSFSVVTLPSVTSPSGVNTVIDNVRSEYVLEYNWGDTLGLQSRTGLATVDGTEVGITLVRDSSDQQSLILHGSGNTSVKGESKTEGNITLSIDSGGDDTYDDVSTVSLISIAP